MRKGGSYEALLALETAALLCGGIAKLARKLGVRPQSIQVWLRYGRAPVGRVVDIERATAGKVTRKQLRPDIFI